MVEYPGKFPDKKEAIAKETWEYITRLLTTVSTVDDVVNRLDNAIYGLTALKSRVLERLEKTDFDIKLPDARAALIDSLGSPNIFKADVSNLVTKAYLDAELAKIKNRSGSTYDFEKDSLEAAGDEIHHTTGIFPHDTNLTLTFTAHADANTWSSWGEIVDSGANKFSDLITRDGHITAFMIEECETKEKVFIFEVAYGDAKTLVSHYRFIAGETVKLPPIQQIRIRGEHFPADELIYYRMKCEEAGSKTCLLHIRYYLHRS